MVAQIVSSVALVCIDLRLAARSIVAKVLSSLFWCLLFWYYDCDYAYYYPSSTNVPSTGLCSDMHATKWRRWFHDAA